ncbi:MAG TPA: hypothetical protein PLZ36_19165, partial [Armatimonadota bacterium]|nr:hypothetical protein [Armatimonadota bacterium]
HEEAPSDRVAVISSITAPWIDRYCPELWRAHPPTDLASPTDVQAYLTTALRYPAPVRDTGETPLTITHPAMLIRINASFTMDLSPLELYEATRGVWRVDARRVERVELAFAVYRGIICEVYRITGWYPSGITRYTTRDDSHFKSCDPPRMEFQGVVATDVRHLYVGQSVKHYFARGSANPITYVNV